MATLELPEPNLVGRVAYIEPLKQWGYLHGATGERVYFHASTILGGIAELGLGDEVCYDLANAATSSVRRR